MSRSRAARRQHRSTDTLPQQRKQARTRGLIYRGTQKLLEALEPRTLLAAADCGTTA